MIDPALLAPEGVRPLTRAEYDRLVDLGFFEDERVELLHGLLVKMSPQGTGHIHVVTQLTALFVKALNDRALVRPQGPYAASDDSEPEPDLALVPVQDYSHAHASQAYLMIEVAESSLRKDRLVKAQLYAQAGVAEYWIVNLKERVFEVYRDLRDGAYANVSSHGDGEAISPVAFPDIQVPIARVLPTPAPTP